MKTLALALLAAALVLFAACRKAQKAAAPQAGGTESKAENRPEENAGAEAIDFTMTAMDGTEQSAAKLAAQNKLTIIDFWASWCGPCRQEMPRLVQLYNMYKDKGLGIIGVSLDEDRAKWETAVSKMNMQWPQLSDLQGWDNAAAQQFGVQSIPFTIVVDSQSRPIAAGLRGNRLARLVEERLGGSNAD